MTIEFSEDALRDLRRIDRQDARRITAYMKGVSLLDDPRDRGKALSGNLAGLWRYRIGDHRAICVIEDDLILLSVLRVGHRRDIYGKL